VPVDGLDERKAMRTLEPDILGLRKLRADFQVRCGRTKRRCPSTELPPVAAGYLMAR
jgi:hypothetical protein